MTRHFLSTAILLLASITAQTPSGLIGITAASPLLVTESPTDCRADTCRLAIPPIGVGATAAGGTAWDATRSAAWVSNGLVLTLVDPTGCRELCAPHRPLAGREIITGLAVDESRKELILTDSTNTIRFFSLACPITRELSSCIPTSLPAGHTIGGVAFSEPDDLVFFSSSDFSSPTSPGNILHVARRATPCTVICRIPVGTCGRRTLLPIHGVAYDACTSTVWCTDGVSSVALSVDVTRCVGREIACCEHGLTEFLAGLCWMPSRATPVGRSCAAAPCAACAPIVHETVGDPTLANGSFGLAVSGAPAPSTAYAILGVGACTSGLSFPPLCGPMYVPLAPIAPLVLGPVPATGLGACGGSGVLTLPIPGDRALCGATFCSQMLGLCVSGTTLGVWLSNAANWKITSS